MHTFRLETLALLRLATPLIISQLAQTGMGFVDTVMAGRYSAVSLAAVALGSSVWLPVFLALTGVLMATTPMIAQDVGGGRLAVARHTVAQGRWLALLLGLGAGLLVWSSDALYPWLGAEAAVIEQAGGYVRAVAWGMPAIALFQLYRCFNEGFQLTRPHMVVSLLALLCNIPLNYVLIYGKLGLPALGAEGCGWATAIIMWLECGLMMWLSHRNPQLKPITTALRWSAPELARQRQILLLGLPIGFAIFFEVSMFTLVALFLAPLGATVVSGHQIAISFSSLTFMLPLSISMAITIRAGHALGAGQPEAARFSCYCGLALTLGCAALSASVMLGLPELIAGLYSSNPEVQALAVRLLLLAGLYQFSDALQVSAAGSLRAYKDTLVPFLVVFVAYWLVGLPLGYTLALTEHFGEALGAPGFWLGLIAGLSFAAILLNGWLWRISRRALLSPAGSRVRQCLP